MFNIESEAELDAICQVAGAAGVADKVAPIALRVNSNVETRTCRYISTGKKESKCGMNTKRAEWAAHQVATTSTICMIRIHTHTSSRITSTEPYAKAVTKGHKAIGNMRNRGHPISWSNMRGGYGINYRPAEAGSIQEFGAVIAPAVQAAKCRLAIELGRAVVGNAGILVSRVIYTKRSGDKRFLIQDAAINDLIRPALYEAFHRILPVNLRTELQDARWDAGLVPASAKLWDLVGPVCESGDFLAKDHPLPTLKHDALIPTFTARAYGMVKASNYNSHPRSAKILADHRRSE